MGARGGASKVATAAAWRWESASTAAIGRPASWAGSSVSRGGRVGALGDSLCLPQASRLEIGDYLIIRKMNHSSKAKGLNVPKSDKQHSKKSHTAHLPQVSKAEEIPAQEDISARKIQRAWFMHLDKVIFQLLKHTICAAEYCVTHEILKNVSPSEAKLTKDPSMKCKVRFRFSGETFPPFIVFKIFLHTEGHGYKYFSGKNLFKPSSKAVIDACKMMGRQKFYEQIMEDERLFQKFKVTDHVDIVTTQDYMQVRNLDLAIESQTTKKAFLTLSFKKKEQYMCLLW